MITITLLDKSYEVPFISGAAMRRIDGIQEVFDKAKAEEPLNGEDIDTACEWFASLFGNQFSVQELLDGYPVDDMLEDIFTAYIAVQRRATRVLREFPIPPTARTQMLTTKATEAK